MISDWNTFMSRYDAATTAVKEAIDSALIPDFAAAQVQSGRIEAAAIPPLIAYVADVLLGVISVNTLTDELEKDPRFQNEHVPGLIVEVKRFVETVIPAAPNAAPTPTATSAAAEPEPVEEADPHAVQPLRTMEEDVDRIHGYGSYRKIYPDPNATDENNDDPSTPSYSSSQEDVLGKQE